MKIAPRAAGKAWRPYVAGLAEIFRLAVGRWAPVVWTALGAAAVFYGFAPRYREAFLAALALGGVSVAACAGWAGRAGGANRKDTACREGAAGSAGNAGRMNHMSRAGLALALGLAWGAAAALTETARLPPAEFRRFPVARFSGVVLSDGRRTSSGNTVATIGVSEATFAPPGLSARLSWPRARFAVTLITEGRDDLAAGRAVRVARPAALGESGALFYAGAKDVAPGGFTGAASSDRAAAKRAAQTRIAAISGSAFPLAQALLIGVADELDGAESALFREAGCAHILSLSGQHLSILCSLVTLLFAKLLKRSNLADVASFLFASAFTWLAGAGPSLLRSTLMTLAGIVLRRIDRPQRGVAVLSFVFCVALGLRPSDARSLSFTLSYAAMVGLIVLSPRWESFLWRAPKIAAKPLAASLAALCATASISLSSFGFFSTGGILASSLSGPLILVFMWSLLGSSLVGAVLPFLDAALSRWHELLHGAILVVMRLGAAFPAVRPANPRQSALVLAAIAALSLFVYTSPYGERALFLRSAARSSAKLKFREPHDHRLRFARRDKNIPRNARPRHVQAIRPELPR